MGSCRPRWSGAGTGIVNTFRPIKQRRVVPSFTDACCRPLLMINEALAGTSQFIISFFISSPWFLECVKNEFLRYSQFQKPCLSSWKQLLIHSSKFDRLWSSRRLVHWVWANSIRLLTTVINTQPEYFSVLGL